MCVRDIFLFISNKFSIAALATVAIDNRHQCCPMCAFFLLTLSLTPQLHVVRKMDLSVKKTRVIDSHINLKSMMLWLKMSPGFIANKKCFKYFF